MISPKHAAVSLLGLWLPMACGERAERAEMVAGAGVVIVLPITTTSEEARRHFMTGQHAMDVGRSLDAHEHFERAAQADPEFAFAYLRIANTATSLDEFRTNLERAEEHAAHASEAERLLIEIARKGFDNDREGQRQAAERLVEIQPASPRAWLALAGAQSALGEEEEARASLRTAAELAPTFVPAYAQLGSSYVFNEPRDPAKAEEYMQKVVSLEPNEPFPHIFLGGAYRAQGELEKARDAYTRAAELDPENALAVQQRGHVHSFLGRYDEARADYDAAIALGRANEKASYAVYRALVHVHAGQPKGAVEELDRVVESIDGLGIPEPAGLKIFALGQQATIAMHQRIFEAAEKAIRQRSALQTEAAKRVGTDEFRRAQEANIAYFEGQLAARKGDYATARQKAEESMKLLEPDRNPRKNEPAHDLLGLIALLQGKHAEAVAHYEKADPNNIYTTYHHALALEGTGRKEEAKALFRKVAGFHFNNAGLALVRKDAIRRAS